MFHSRLKVNQKYYYNFIGYNHIVNVFIYLIDIKLTQFILTRYAVIITLFWFLNFKVLSFKFTIDAGDILIKLVLSNRRHFVLGSLQP